MTRRRVPFQVVEDGLATIGLVTVVVGVLGAVVVVTGRAFEALTRRRAIRALEKLGGAA